MAATNSDPTQAVMTYAACPSCLKLNKISVARARKQKPVCGACKHEINVHGAVVNTTTKGLKTLIAKSPLPVVVDFWAPWCGPCRGFAPTFEKVAEEKAGQIVFTKVNTEADQEASPTFGIRGIPLIVAFKDNNEIARQSGALPYEYFGRWVAELPR